MTILELSTLLFNIGIAAGALLLLLALLQSIRRDSYQPGWVSGLVFFVAVAALLGALLLDAFVADSSTVPLAVVLGLSLAAIVVGLLVVLIENRKSDFSLEGSYGLLLVGLGTLALMAVTFVPLLPDQLSPPTEVPMAVVAATSILPPTPMASSTPRPTTTPMPSATPTAIPSATATPSATPTRARYSTSTPTATPEVTAFCGAVVNYNLNMRTLASQNGEVILVIPFESIVDVGGKNADGDWLFVEYNGQWGWISDEFVSADVRCADAPVLLD